MELNLKNPLVFLDLETTGINIVTDRIVEIAFLKILPDGKQEEKLMLINPEMPIPAQSSAIHGIKDEDVKDAPTFKEVAKVLAKFVEGCDLAGFNSNRFDIPLLSEEFLRAEVDIDLKKRKFIDVQTIFHKMEKRTLGAAYEFYCNKELENAHSAMVDTVATYEVLKSQLDRYSAEEAEARGKKFSPLVNDVDKLSEFSSFDRNVDFAGRIVYNSDGVEVFNFGKHKGKPVEQVLKEEPGYYGWMLNGEFPLYTKKVLTAIRLRAFSNNG
ncbi:DNA polymerase III subunit epsilon [Prolixibacter bellariivorans]|uniref:DNA polymerase III subunit epsilon n=1 Tax=Prolixibacter bellariivorans TaxID=314319 RepID=A0A5M4AZJ5_9BACT|nr:3'-5' exonuclease [Prolixibacter bellariivorans]GET33319.1 DNA polymerase III subunit epsilon [Prolixibacter bellariivorans]